MLTLQNSDLKFLVSFSATRGMLLVQEGCFWRISAEERRPKCKLNNYRRSSTKAQLYRYINYVVNYRKNRTCVPYKTAWNTLCYCTDVRDPLLSIQHVKSETTQLSYCTSILKCFDKNILDIKIRSFKTSYCFVAFYF